MRKLTIAAVFALMMLFAGRAHAITGYLCTVYYYPGADSSGNYGSVDVSLYTGTSCTGSYVGYASFLSTGATTCTIYPLLTAESLIGLLQALRQQMTNNQKVFIDIFGGCANSVAFYPN
jgi:hypothetical protein